MRNLFIKLVGFFVRKIYIVFSEYMTLRAIQRFGKAEKNAAVHYPYNIIGENNIFLEEDVSIGAGSTIFSKNAKIYIGKKSFSGPNLTIISGDHPYIPGIYMRDIRKVDLSNAKDFDKDVIIEQDVWIGANVTILKGVTVGRAAILAAGSVVVSDIPPYAIAGGIPAKVLKFKWDTDDISKHESFLFLKD